MKARFACTAMALLAASSHVSSAAQTEDSPVTAVAAVQTGTEADLPGEVRAALAAAPVVSEILSVRGVEKFDGQVLKVDELVLQRGAIIELRGLNYPWVAIVAKRVRFVDPNVMTVIRRDPSIGAAPAGTAGANGTHGTDGFRNGRNGTNGTAGTAGANGGHGQTTHLPKVYVYAERFEAAGSMAPISQAKLTLEFAGLAGGAGGKGGDGGRGGRGGNGRDGSDSATGCRHSVGDGGNGANGAKGGAGGNGAQGGNGAALVFISSQTGADLLSGSLINNEGGAPGAGAPGGAGGERGRFGDGGSRSTYCRSRGHDGGWGSAGQAGPAGAGDTAPGARGRIQAIVINQVEGFLSGS